MRHRLIAFAVSLVLAAPLARAQDIPPPSPASPPIVRTTLDPAEGAVVGQHIALYVDVLFPGDMPRPPRVTIPDMPGAQVMRFETQGTTLRDTIDGVGYVGQRFEFGVFPRRGGALAIPPAAVTLLDRQGDVTGTVQGPPQKATIEQPKGIDAGSVAIATTRLTLDQGWSPDTKGPLHPGDALVRTITRTAEDIPALAMRDLAFSAPEGVRVYADAPVSQDNSNRGSITGKRVDRVTYVFETDGTFELPAVTQPWWSLADHSAQNASGAARTVTVQAAPQTTSRTGPSASMVSRPGLWAAIAAAIVVVGLLLVALARRLRNRTANPGKTTEQTERAAFDAFRRACDSDDLVATYQALAAWRAAWRSLPAGLAEPPRDAALESALFGQGASDRPSWSHQSARSLFSMQSRFREAQLNPGSPPGLPALPPLNPA